MCKEIKHSHLSEQMADLFSMDAMLTVPELEKKPPKYQPNGVIRVLCRLLREGGY
jgi:hypothetical protein